MLQEAQEAQVKTDKERFNEDFLKFISDSRDWAYTYIETTQEKINSFINDVGPIIDYLEYYNNCDVIFTYIQTPSLDNGLYNHEYINNFIDKNLPTGMYQPEVEEFITTKKDFLKNCIKEL